MLNSQDLNTLISLLSKVSPEQLDYVLKRKYTQNIEIQKKLYTIKED